MLTLLPLTAILGYCFALKRFLTWPIEVIPFFIASVFILVLYFAATVNLLSATSIVMLLTGNGLLALTALFIDKQKLWNEYLTPGLVFLLVFIGLFGFIARHFLATDWDEIYIWLPHTRLLYLHQGFWNASDIIYNKDYPPGGALFQYLFLKFGQYSEGKIYLGQVTLFLIPIIILLRKYTWKNWQTAFLLFSLFLLVIHFLFHIKILVNESLLMDSIVAVYFGAMLSSYYILQNQKYLIGYLLMPASALVLLKPLVIPFLIIIIAVIFTDQFFLKRQTKTRTLFSCCLLFIIPVFIMTTWQRYVWHNFAVNSKWSLINLFIAIKIAIDKTNTILSPLFLKYLQALILPLSFMFLVFLSLGLISHKINNSLNKKRFWTTHCILSGGYVLYLLGLLVIYFFMMPHLMLLQMNSFMRFINIYSIAWSMLILTHGIYFTRTEPIHHSIPLSIRNGMVGLIAVIVALPLFISLHISHQRFVAKNNNQYLRYTIQHQLTYPLHELIKSDNVKIGIVCDGWGLLSFIIALDLLPKNSYILDAHSVYLRQMDYIVSNKRLSHLKNIKQGSTHPFAKLELCADKDFNSVNYSNCSIEEMPFYFYRRSKP